jgi:osmotically inducible protein OsmC
MAVTTAHAVWEGTLKEGKGTMTLPKGKFEGPYTFASRFEKGEATNPEELIGAAHAGCYSMFLSALLTNNGHKPNKITTKATVHLGEGPKIETIELHTEADIPGLDDETFQNFAKQAKDGCPVSKALAGVGEIKLEAKLL